MTVIGMLIPVSLFLGGLGLAAFIWCLRAGQFDDLEGDQARTLFNDEAAAPVDGDKKGAGAGRSEAKGE